MSPELHICPIMGPLTKQFEIKWSNGNIELSLVERYLYLLISYQCWQFMSEETEWRILFTYEMVKELPSYIFKMFGMVSCGCLLSGPNTGNHCLTSLSMRCTAMLTIFVTYVVLIHPGSATGCLPEQYQPLSNNTKTMYDCLYEITAAVASPLECGLHCTSTFLPYAPHGFTFISSGHLCACYPYSHAMLTSQPPPVRVYYLIYT